MITMLRRMMLFVMAVGLGAPLAQAEDASLPSKGERAIQAALAFLSREVPQWSAEHKCFSCHNNGDAARALYLARRQMRPLDKGSLADTTQWLIHPENWENNHGDPAFSDKTLATLQFAAALASAAEAGAVNDPAALRRAAELVAARQAPDGSWKPEGPDVIGSPATWGRTVSTVMAQRTLQRAADGRFDEALKRSASWLRTARPTRVLDAGAMLVGLDGAEDDAAARQRAACLALLQKAQSRGGGWGPYANSPTEPFDTAVALLGLLAAPASAENHEVIRRGAEHLIESQMSDGSWPETTRPAEGTSYAQRLSTTGWATEALLRLEQAGYLR